MRLSEDLLVSIVPITLKNTETQYGLIGRTLHWTSVALMLAVIVFSGQFEDLPDSTERSGLVRQHVTIGLLLLAIMLARFSWRMMNKNPVYSYAMSRWQKLAAISVHYSIYAFVIGQCVLGIALMIVSGDAIHVFDYTIAAPLMEENQSLSQFLSDTHADLTYLAYPLFAVHITAAIYHQIFGVLDD